MTSDPGDQRERSKQPVALGDDRLREDERIVFLLVAELLLLAGTRIHGVHHNRPLSRSPENWRAARRLVPLVRLERTLR